MFATNIKLAILLLVLEEHDILYSQGNVIAESFKNYTGFLTLVLIRSTAFLHTFWSLLVMYKLLDMHFDKWVPNCYKLCNNSTAVIKDTKKSS